MNSKSEYQKLEITNVNSKLINELENISTHLSITRSAFIKMKLSEISNSYPPHMKLPPVNMPGESKK